MYRADMDLGPERIDTDFDFRSDSGEGDPDAWSPTLARYHQLLWSKPLPSGARFELTLSGPPYRLRHRSEELGEFSLSSDTLIPTWMRLRKDDTRWQAVAPIIEQIPQAEREKFSHIGYTSGGVMIWPCNRVPGVMTINQARGCNRSISDRFDLTLECIRRHYRGERSQPLAATLAAYSAFFELFRDFKGFVDFFLLQDLVNEDAQTVRFMLPFDDFFIRGPLPRDLDEYRLYLENAIAFIKARNRRIPAYVARP